MSKAASLLFAFIAYAIFLMTFIFFILFVGDMSFAPVTVNRGPEAPPLMALVIDLGLITLFGLQHSVMARQGFKRIWTRIVPAPLERSVYVLATSAVLIMLFAFWRPIDEIAWSVNGVGAAVLWALFGLGWLIVLASTFLINHFELFGLQQAWLYARSREGAEPEFKQPLLYRLVRHPLYTGLFLGFWATPDMSYGHLLLALGMSVYMLIGIRFEERDLLATFGIAYEDYRNRVGMLMPRFRSPR